MLGFVVYMVYGVWLGVWGLGLRAVDLIPDEEDRLLRPPLDTRTCLIRAKAEDAQADALCRVLHVHGLDDIFNIIQIPSAWHLSAA
jgi:hypothetical protein